MDFSKLHLTPANHVKAAKLVRSNAASREGAECARFLQKSNTLLIAAALACKATGFARSEQLGMDALWPDWSVIDAQIAQFELERVEAPSIMPSAKVSFANLRAPSRQLLSHQPCFS